MKNLMSKLVVMLMMVFISHLAFAGVTPPMRNVVNVTEIQNDNLNFKPKTLKKPKKSQLKWHQKIAIKFLNKKFMVAMNKTLAIILTIFLPGLVWLWVGLITDWDKAWWICLLLCLLFLLPGWIYGLIKIIKS